MAESFKKIALRARERIERSGLEGIVQILNGEGRRDHPLHDEVQANLIRLVQAWRQAQDRKSVAVLKIEWPRGCPKWQEIERRCRSLLLPSGTGVVPGVAYVAKGPWTAWDFAIQEFIWLITNPLRDRLSGPCARCKRYYIKKRKSQKVYCSRRCGNTATAVLRTRAKWDEQRGKRLTKAKEALRIWADSKISEEFRTWAVKRYPDLTKKFLTRAINNKEIVISQDH
jgi:hypothetical protein